MDLLYLEFHWYGDGAKHHIDHVTRVRSDIAHPLWEKRGEIDESFLLEPVIPVTKPLTNKIFEVMTYVRDVEEADLVRGYLEERLKRGTNAYVHYDEGGIHGHFICRNADKAGKALHFMKGVFREVRASIARLLGRRVPAKGTGRRHVSVQEYIAYPPSIALAKAEYEEILEAAEKVMLYYQGYKAVAVGCRTEQDIILRARTVNPRQSMRDQLPCRHLWVLNNRGTIVFAPIIEGASNVRVLYLHDVPESRLRQMPRGSLIVQTDKHRFDAHLHIPPSMKPTEIDGWQEILSALNGSSRSAVAQDYYRPLPGFRGEHSFRAAIRDDIVAEGTFRFDLLRAKVKEQRELQAQAASRVAYQGSPRWGHFSHPDRSVTDMAYAVHLLQRGYDEDEVSDVLIAESEDIALRADGDLRGYLARIIRGAHREHSRVLTTLKERAACI